jgi:uncharacterized membrane protein HdeD (DUF308 family)
LGHKYSIMIVKNLRTLYFVRAAFSTIWVILVAVFARTHVTVASTLFIIYPAWDAIATYLDIRVSSPAVSKTPQYANAAISIATTVGVALALQKGVPEALIVFGVWAILTGVIQLLLALRRKKQYGGQWPMIISGGQSMIGGSSFIILAHAPTMGINSLAGYAAFGALYFLLAAAFRSAKKQDTLPG